MACLQEANAGRGDCNGDSHLSRGSGRSCQEHECGKAPGYDNIDPEFLKNLGTKSEEMASDISDANYLGKEPPQELENCKKNSRHP